MRYAINITADRISGILKNIKSEVLSIGSKSEMSKTWSAVLSTFIIIFQIQRSSAQVIQCADYLHNVF